MGLVPFSKTGKVQFFQSKVAPWTANATAIGTTAGEVSAMDAKLTAAQAAIAAQVAASEAAKTATYAADNAVLALADAGADIIRQIRAKGAISGSGVYELAEIPAPAVPTNRPPPATPGNFTVSLEQNGSLHLKWKCANPAGTNGTLYQIFRRIGTGGEFTYMGGVGGKCYTDSTIPAGATQLTYQIQAVRTTAVGQWAQFNVNFGTNEGGVVVASVSSAQPVTAPKLAA